MQKLEEIKIKIKIKIKEIKFEVNQSTQINYMGQNKNPKWYFGTKTKKKYLQKGGGKKVGSMSHSSKFADCMGFYLQKWGKTNPPFKGFLPSLAL